MTDGALTKSTDSSIVFYTTPSPDIAENGQNESFLRAGTRKCDRPKGRRGIGRFVRKYLLEGQQYSDVSEESEDESNRHLEQFLETHRKYIGFLVPCLFMQLVWWTLAIRYDLFRLFPTHYELPLTMIVGATVAGMTSEGGGAVAFPVMTLVLKINPIVARDFSLMIQSCGMTSAAFTIIWMRIKLEWHSIVVCTMGSTAGIIFGLEFVDKLLTGALCFILPASADGVLVASQPSKRDRFPEDAKLTFAIFTKNL